MNISRTILDYVMEHQEGVLTSDAQEDQRWDAAQSIVTSRRTRSHLRPHARPL